MVSNLINQIRNSTYVANIGWLVRGNVLAQILQVIALPILSRIYTPREFGVFALFTAFSGLSSVVLSIRMDSAILVANDADAKVLVTLAARCVYAVTLLLLGLLVYLIHNDILGYSVMPNWAPAVMAVALLGIGFFNIGRAICLRDGNAMLLAKSRIERSAANILVKIVWGLVTSGGYGLLVGEAVGAWIALRKVGSKLLTRSIILRQKLGREVGAVWRRFRKFPYLELPSSVFDQATLTLPVPMLASIGGAEVAGAYAIARIVVIVPNAQIGRAVGDGFQLRASQIVRGDNKSQLLATIGKTILTLAVVGLIPFGLLWLLSPWAFPFFLGSAWEYSGELAALLAIWMYFAFVVSPISRVLSVLQRQEIKLFYDLFVFGAICAIYWYSTSAQISSREFVQALVALNVVGYSLYLFLILIVAGKAR